MDKMDVAVGGSLDMDQNFRDIPCFFSEVAMIKWICWSKFKTQLATGRWLIDIQYRALALVKQCWSFIVGRPNLEPYPNLPKPPAPLQGRRIWGRYKSFMQSFVKVIDLIRADRQPLRKGEAGDVFPMKKGNMFSIVSNGFYMILCSSICGWKQWKQRKHAFSRKQNGSSLQCDQFFAPDPPKRPQVIPSHHAPVWPLTGTSCGMWSISCAPWDSTPIGRALSCWGETKGGRGGPIVNGIWSHAETSTTCPGLLVGIQHQLGFHTEFPGLSKVILTCFTLQNTRDQCTLAIMLCFYHVLAIFRCGLEAKWHPTPRQFLASYRSVKLEAYHRGWPSPVVLFGEDLGNDDASLLSLLTVTWCSDASLELPSPCAF